MTEAAAQIRVPLEKIAPDTIRLERALRVLVFISSRIG